MVRIQLSVFTDDCINFVRMTKLLDDEIEEDELFWNQESLKEVLLYYC